MQDAAILRAGKRDISLWEFGIPKNAFHLRKKLVYQLVNFPSNFGLRKKISNMPPSGGKVHVQIQGESSRKLFGLCAEYANLAVLRIRGVERPHSRPHSNDASTCAGRTAIVRCRQALRDNRRPQPRYIFPDHPSSPWLSRR